MCVCVQCICANESGGGVVNCSCRTHARPHTHISLLYTIVVRCQIYSHTDSLSFLLLLVGCAYAYHSPVPAPSAIAIIGRSSIRIIYPVGIWMRAGMGSKCITRYCIIYGIVYCIVSGMRPGQAFKVPMALNGKIVWLER